MSESKNKLDTSLSSAITKTMENMTFESVKFVDSPRDSNLDIDDRIWAVLPMVRPYQGELVLELSLEFGGTLAEEVWGFPSETISDDAVKDMLAEIANTIAGRFNDELLPPDEEFELGLPDTGLGTVPKSAQKVTTVLLNIGNHQLLTSITGEVFNKFVEN